jgi:hypothetical protein
VEKETAGHDLIIVKRSLLIPDIEEIVEGFFGLRQNVVAFRHAIFLKNNSPLRGLAKA